ncbi:MULTISPECIES: hypothetical protein [Pseudoalteromonas]|uniref:Uncharacterized protein n=1 Tax=Pseudoalteromonas amylolytica TaxID=1859457 RepID=A0A1S1MUE5_9GAMM|nr:MULTISPECIES: hypothetical protein [Pseudoalteromonas]OHU84113.1 hypothetical protein BFC16_01880 [Pseudoalteromonas sp. JW3]OHU92375.1 hypothetical protein BET10_05875 [Pseudoalteromonas amylolytica]
MDSEIITLVAAVIGIFGDLIAITGYLSKKNEGHSGFSVSFLNSVSQKVYAYLFASATWILLVLVWFLGFEPYGPFILDREANQLVAIMMSFPVTIAFLFSAKHLFSGGSNAT